MASEVLLYETEGFLSPGKLGAKGIAVLFPLEEGRALYL